MRYRLSHKTIYQYATPVSDSVMEMRICPGESGTLRVLNRKCKVRPTTELYSFHDYFDNRVEYFSLPFRHSELVVENHSEVETISSNPPQEILNVPLAESRQLLNNRYHSLYFYLNPCRYVPHLQLESVSDIPKIPDSTPIEEAALAINQFIYQNFHYDPGSTSISTSVESVLKNRRGVCQDYTHVFLAIARSMGIPARYASGYVESQSNAPHNTTQQASHAWVEILLPGNVWWGLDPTNNKPTGLQHIKVAVGRDFGDVSPIRGTFRGGHGQKMQVHVSLQRLQE